MEQPLTPAESLRLIESMIWQAKRSFGRSSFYFLLWGFLLLAAMVANYLFRDLPPSYAQGLPWGIAGALGGIISSIYGTQSQKKDQVHNPMDGIIGWLWLAFVVTLIILIVGLAGNGIDPGPAITVITGLPTFMTGRIMRFKPLIIGGFLFWGLGVAMFFAEDQLLSTLLYCCAMLFGYIVPGFLLKGQENELRTA
jgi:hypothetical protein